MADAQKKEEGKPAADAQKPAEGEAVATVGSKKKLFIMIGAGVGALLIIGGAAFFFLGGKPAAPHGDEQKEAGHGQAADDGHGKKEDGHGKPEEHGKKDDHGAKKEEHGAKPDGHGKDDKAAAGHGEKAEGEHATTTVGGFGETYLFKTFQTNLGNPLDNHYVRFDVAVEYKGGAEQKAELDKRLVQFRAAIVSIASRKSREFLLGPDGKDQLSKEILIRLNRYMSKPVESVFITDILIE